MAPELGAALFAGGKIPPKKKKKFYKSGANRGNSVCFCLSCQTEPSCQQRRIVIAEMGSKVQVIPNGMTLQEFMAGKSADTDAENMTSADYYADSYSHFGIHGNKQNPRPLDPILTS